MKIYTQADVDAIARDEDGYKHIPQGKYVDRINFYGKCIFPNDCTLGNDCKLGNYCKLGTFCTLGNYCKLGNYCTLGNYCKLGVRCTLGNDCKLGNYCTLGVRCIIGQNCTMEGGAVKDARYIKVGPIGSRNDDAYFYADGEGKIFVRAGCFFGTEDEFLSKLMETHGNNEYASGYKLALEFASTMLRERMV